MIRFEHVTKSYGKTTILKDLNFTIPDGQFVILIGPSGCGKTTTMKLINRLLEPDSGIISINGQDIRLQDKVELRRHIGYVIQQIGLFPNMTVAQNICVVPRLLKYDKARCDQIVKEMLPMVNMEQYADKYPSELSGGQQQRIAIARALVRKPEILILDDSGSALDFATDAALRKSIREMDTNPTVFIVSQRTSSIQHADKIIVLDDGKIAGIGKHDELLNSCPVYSEIYNSQFKKEAV